METIQPTQSIHSTEPLQAPVPVKIIPSRPIIHLALQLLALAFLLNFCYNVLSPFIDLLLWATIFAVALYPLQQKLKGWLKGRGTLAAVILTVILLMVFIVPGLVFTLRTAKEAKVVLTDYRAGKIKINPPNESVKTWPLVGNKTYTLWQQASTDLNTFIDQNPDKVKAVSSRLVDMIKSTGKGLALLTLAIIVSGVLLCYATQVAVFTRRLFNHLLNSTKIDMASLASTTIRNVVKGILGVAVLQSACAGIGMLVAGIPYAGIWTLLCLVLAIVQIGITPVSLGVIIYVWAADFSTTTAILLTIWMILVGLVDNVLKPLIMGKGAPVPMLIIFLGAIGGFIYAGFIGLFTGAVVLSVGYRLFDIWLKGTEI
jgi:predicted PurR-regulated permease PerM